MTSPKHRFRDQLILRADQLGLGRLARAVVERRRGPIRGRILAFHEVSPDEADAFERILGLLRSSYDPVPLASMVSREARAAADREDPAVAVTFDDGFASWMDVVAPRLREYEIPATFFISSGFVDAETPDEMARFARENLRLSPTRSLDWDDVRELHDDPLFDVGGHTRNHADLGALPPERVETEIRADRDRFVEETGEAPAYFAYPFGQPRHVTAAAVDAVESADYRGAFRFRPGFVTASDDPYRVDRDGVEPGFSNRVLRARLNGSYDPFKRVQELVGGRLG